MARKQGVRPAGTELEETRIAELGLKSSKAGRQRRRSNGNGHNGAAANGTRGNSVRKQPKTIVIEKSPVPEGLINRSTPAPDVLKAYESVGVGGVMTDTAELAKHVEEAQNPNIGSVDLAVIKRQVATETLEYKALEPTLTEPDLIGLFSKQMALLGPNGSQIVKDIVHTALNGGKSLRTARTAKPQNDIDKKDPFADIETDTFEVGTKKKENPTSHTDTVKGGGETDMSATETAYKEYLDRNNIGGAGGKKDDSSAKKGADFEGYKIDEANQNAIPRVSIKQTLLGGISETAFSMAVGFGTKTLLAKMGIAAMVATFPVSAPIVIGGLVAASTTAVVYGLTGKLTWKKLATTMALGALGGGAAAQFGHMISNSALAQRVTAGITGGATAATTSAAWMLTKEGRQLSMAQKVRRMVTAVAIGSTLGFCAGEITEIKDKVGDFLQDLVPTGNHQTTTPALPAAVEPAPVVEHGKAPTPMPGSVHDNVDHNQPERVPEDASPQQQEPASSESSREPAEQEQAPVKKAHASASHAHHHAKTHHVNHASDVVDTPKVEAATTIQEQPDVPQQQDVSRVGESHIEKVDKWERVVVTGHDGQEFKGPLRNAGTYEKLHKATMEAHASSTDDYRKSPYSEKPNPIRNVGKSVVNLFKPGR